MVHEWIGNAGHFLLIISFVTSLLTAFAYISSEVSKDSQEWKSFARWIFRAHAASVFGVVILLFTIIYQHYYEYHYAWSHSSNMLPTHYMISCFWEGQEGSFLLWIFWHVCLGLILIRKPFALEGPVMVVFALVQAFLCSMILGVVIPFAELKIGSSPFILLRDVMLDAPIFKTNPNYVPEDGTGLNPLLQNYWMVIHPPTLFLGFAATLIPFAFVIAGLAKKDVISWVKPAFSWTLFASVVLGVGILMGGYWAYETLNFGGYWNWDPVENAVYIPWLVLVAAFHLMIIRQKYPHADKWSALSIIITFILILYSTFLTRSGILGDASVHSFTDLGLSGQLLIYLLFFVGVSIYYLVKGWHLFPKDTSSKMRWDDSATFVFAGATLLCLAAFQVLVPTSIPAIKSFLGVIGIESNMAPPTDQVAFYTKYQMWFGVAISLVAGIGQYLWWNKVDKTNWTSAFSLPIAVTLLVSAIVIAWGKVANWQYVVLLVTSLFTSVVSVISIYKLITSSRIKLSGGAIAHLGIGCMLLGILASSGYSKIVSINRGGSYSKNFSDEMNRENLMLFINDPHQMGAYQLIYEGAFSERLSDAAFVSNFLLSPTSIAHKKRLNATWVNKGDTLGRAGDTLEINPENTYYKIRYQDTLGREFTLFPRIQNNPQMGYVPSPDIRRGIQSDLYTHITNIPDPESATQWSQPDSLRVGIGDTLFLNDFVAVLEDVVKLPAEYDEDVNIKAKIRVFDYEQSYLLEPMFKVKGNAVYRPPFVCEPLGIEMTFDMLYPETRLFSFAVRSSQKEWVILKAIEKPFINILWFGTLLMAIGITLATYRRWKESKK